MDKHTTYTAERITAVCRDCGFSGINVFIHIFVSVEYTLLENPQPRQAPRRCASFWRNENGTKTKQKK